MIMLTVNNRNILSALLCLLLIILCFSLLSCRDSAEDNGDSGAFDSSYENTASAKAEAATGGAQNTEDANDGASQEKESSPTGFNESKLGGNRDSISWEELTDKATKR